MKPRIDHFLYFLCFIALSSYTLASDHLWSNPVIVGASVSDGYDHREPIGGVKSEKLSLEHFLDEMIKVPHGKIHNLGNKFFFMRPEGVSVKQVENAEKMKPSFVLAPDYLFWLVYGNRESEHARMQSLEAGLALLDKFDCPIVVGNIPNAYKAVYKMLSRSQMPTLDTLAAANERISKWARIRKNVVIMDNNQFMQQSHENTKIEIKNNIIAAGQTRDLLQKDFLHPTLDGARAISLALLERLQAQTDFPHSDVNWKLK